VKIHPVVPDEDVHSLHAYYVRNPESPDGTKVLYFASTAANGEQGELRILDRTTGQTTVIARDIIAEDAHRAACQQWISGGKRIAYHNCTKSGEWVVVCVDVETGKATTVAQHRQLGFGSPTADLLPMYSPHWDPRDFRDLELYNAATGETRRPPLTAEGARKAYPEEIKKRFEDKPISVFFPVLSPDASRVFFKLASAGNGDFRSKGASDRECILGYDLKAQKFLFMQGKWGHPAWNADSRQIINVGGLITDSNTGERKKIPNQPPLPGSHPSFSPDGKLYTSDETAESLGKPKGWWAVGVGDVATGEFVVLKSFDNSKGAKSWRVSHPHPVFSADGKRLYFNVSDGPRTRLFVAEAAD
jgi:hypothetical protein